MVTSTERLLLY